MKKIDAIILGAGMAGLSTAFAMSRRGKEVLVLEKIKKGAASMAAAGILDPLLEMERKSPILPLALAAFDYYPRFLRQIKREAKEDSGYEKTGMILVSTNAREEKSLLERYKWHEKTGVPVKWLSKEEVRRKEPTLLTRASAGIFYPTVGRVQPERLIKVLRKAAIKKGVRFKRIQSEPNLQFEKGAFRSVKIGKQKIYSNHIIVASGSWSGLQRMNRRMIPVSPVRGQLMVVRGKVGTRRILHSSEGYYSVPWGKNEFLLGSTVEHVGYRPGVTSLGVKTIKKGIGKFIPEMSRFKKVKSWSGLRPYCQDGLPLIGSGKVKGLMIATGFFRSGILLSPFVGEWLARNLDRKTQEKLMKPFSPRRFGF